jgi:opacity protein-like surface antigen
MMRNKVVIGILAAFGLMGASAHAAESDAGAYVGVGIGTSTIKIDDFNFDESDTAFKLFGGYMFNPYVGLELAYLNAGEPSATVSGVSVEVSVTGFSGSVVGNIPLGDRFALFGKLGFAQYDVEATARIGAASASADDSGSELAYGVGMSVSLTDRFSLRAEYEMFDVEDGDFTILSAGAVLKF